MCIRDRSYIVHYLDYTNKTTKSVYTDWSLMVGTVQHKTGSSRQYTESHIRTIIWSGVLIEYVVRNESISWNFAHYFHRAGNERPIKPWVTTQQHCNGNGGGSIQWIKLVQHEKDRTTQRTHNELTDWTNSWLTSRPDTQPELDKLTTSQVDYTRNLRLN